MNAESARRAAEDEGDTRMDARMDARIDQRDADAMRRCAAGDIAGLDDLVARHQLAAVRIAYLLVQDASAAEDIVQESFLRVFRAAPRFRAGAPFAPWFHRIVLNSARQYLRSARRRRETSLDAFADAFAMPSQRLPVASDPLRSAERNERRQEVAAVLATLTRKQREALVLRFYGGYTDGEIAGLLGVPSGTARWRLHAALRAFERSAAHTYPWLLDDAHPGSVRRLERIESPRPTTQGRATQ